MNIIFTIAFILSSSILSAQSFKTAQPDSIKISATDINNFWSAYDQLATAKTHPDSLHVIERNYLQLATYGLKLYQEASHSNAESFLQAIRTHPRLLESIRTATLALVSYKDRIIESAKRLKQLYPASLFPEIFFVMGKFEVLGSKFDNFLYVGAELISVGKDSPLNELHPALREMITPTTNVDVVCVHELVHYQQKLQVKTNLEAALAEGGAEFIAYQLTNKSTMQSVFDQVNKETEKMIWTEFAQQLDKPIEAKWFLAQPDLSLKRPGMLGYVLGFRICESYYHQAKDKKKALADIISLTNPTEIYQQSNFSNH